MRRRTYKNAQMQAAYDAARGQEGHDRAMRGGNSLRTAYKRSYAADKVITEHRHSAAYAYCTAALDNRSDGL